MLVTSEDVQLLTQVGFIATGRADVERAEAIFGALLAVRPRRAFAHVGLACARMNAGDAGAAARALERALPGVAEGEDADTVQAFLGLALQLDGRLGESRRVLQEVVRRAQPAEDNDGLRLARRMLGEPQAQAVAVT